MSNLFKQFLQWLDNIFTAHKKPGVVVKVQVPTVPVAKSPKRSKSAAAAAAAAGIAVAMPLVAAFEGYYPRAYRDPVGVKTICYGQTAVDGADFSKTYTKAECEKMLGVDLAKYQAQVRRCVPTVQPPHREAALVSFTYNLGGGALCRTVGPKIAAGKVAEGCKAMLAYNHAGGRVLAGLTRRRQAEYKLCLRND